MKIRSLEIENFGIFSGAKFDFSASGLQLIQGANEAGKSTLLQLIREVLFGFAVKNRYALADNNGEMAATATIELRDGRTVRFRRRKGTKDVVVGQVDGNGDAVDEAALGAMLGRANARLYERVFGFSLAELAAGEKSLEDADISEALYGGGLGGLANFKEVETALEKEHQQLFKSQGKTLTINKLLASIKDTAASLNNSTIKPRDYKQLCTARDEAEAAVKELRKRRDDLAKRFRHTERLHKALPLWLKLVEVEKESAAIDVPEGIAYDAEKEYRRTVEAVDVANGELAEEQEAIEDALTRLDNLKLEPQLTEGGAAATVKSLEQDIGEIKRFRQDLPNRIQEAAEIRYAQGETVARLNPSWDIAFLEKFSVSSEQAEAVAAIAEESRDLAKDLKSCETQIKDKTRKLADETARLESLHVSDAQPAIEELVENAGRYEVDLQSFSETDAAIAEAAVKIEELRRGLESVSGGECGDLDSLRVPLEAKINEYAVRFQENRDAASQLAAKLEANQLDLSDGRFELASIDAGQNIPDRGQLEKARELRDTGWELIRKTCIEGRENDEDVRRWLAECDTRNDGLDVTADLSGSVEDTVGQANRGTHEVAQDDDFLKARLIEKYEAMLAAADALADRRQEKAELVAARERIAENVRRLENKRRELENIRAEREGEAITVAEQWRELWAERRLVPGEPEVMRQWLRMHADFRERLGRQRILETKRERLRETTEDFERRLRLSMGGGEGAPSALLREARRRVESAREATAERRQIEKNRLTLRREIDDLGADLEETSQKQRQCRERLKIILGGIGLPDDWDARLADKVLKELHGAKLKLQQAFTLDVRVRDMRGGIADYEAKVRRACEQLSPELADLPAETAAASLAQRLADADKTQSTHDELTKTVDKARRNVKNKSAQTQILREKIQRLRDAAGADSDAEFFRVAAASRQKADLLQEAQALSRDIKSAAGAEDIDAFRARLADADADSLQRELHAAGDELAAVEKQYEEAAKHAGAVQAELKRLDGQSEAAGAAADLESRRAELRAAVDRWATLVMAQTLMKNAVARFEREHQPAMLESVARLFSAMTLGRYQVVRRRLDEKNTILVEDAKGGEKEPSQLSTGTREQLYLAIRLAYVGHYCRAAEPLPLVMDDVLVNFDDARAAETLDVLLEIAADVQIIFLTCHRRTADMIAARLPEMRAIELAFG